MPFKTVLITGANSGIGLAAARMLAQNGHQVFVACRTRTKAQEAAEKTGAAGFFECDLASLDSIRSFVQEWDRSTEGNATIDALCLNAGVALGSRGSTPSYTKEGFEETVGVNHLGHFILANLLLKNLEASCHPQPRIVVTASSVHDPEQPGGNRGKAATLGDLSGLKEYAEDGKFDMVSNEVYDGKKAYRDSKLCNVMFTQEMQRRLSEKGSKVTANCFSPGLIPSTGLFRNQNFLFVKIFDWAMYFMGVSTTTDVGASRLTYLVESSDVDGSKGGYFTKEPGKQNSGTFINYPPSKEAQNVEKARELWDLSSKLVKLS